MKHVVIDEEVQGSDIRNPRYLAEMQDLARRDAASLLARGTLDIVSCPACENASGSPAYEKDGFQYMACGRCGSRYVSPRPDATTLTRYYKDSEAARSRRRYLAESEEQGGRAEVIWARARWMCRIMDEAGPRANRDLVEVYGRYPSLTAQLRQQQCFLSVLVFRPEVEFERTIASIVDVAPSEMAAASLFEHLEHAHDPSATLNEIAGMLRAGGILFLTTRTASGFDVQVLREHDPSVFPPEHLNLLSVEGVSLLLDRTGFDVVELSTPGQLDVEFVGEALGQNAKLPVDPFWRYFYANRDEEARQDLQLFLQKHRLSSHLRIAARKRGT